MGSSPGCGGASGWTRTASGMPLRLTISADEGMQFSVRRILRGLQFPASLTTTGNSAGSGSIALPSCRVGNICR